MSEGNEVPRDAFLSEEDLDLAHLTMDELIAWWNLWLEQAQSGNALDERIYSHGVFVDEPERGTPKPKG